MRLLYLLAALLPAHLAWAQQAPPSPPAETATWFGGFGLGNGIETHGGYLGGRWLALGRARYKWWNPDNGPAKNDLFSSVNTRSRQAEVAVLVGGVLPLGATRIYGATGLAYVGGRQAGTYRYSTVRSGFLSPDYTHYYAYRQYRALGLPLEVGLLGAPLGRLVRLGAAVQANLNPEHSEFCLLLTVNGGRFRPSRKASR